MDQLQKIKEQIQKLLDKNRELQLKVETLQKQLEEKNKEVEQLWRENLDYKDKIGNLSMAKGLANNSEEAKMAQQRLSRLVRKIDRCVELLNKQE